MLIKRFIFFVFIFFTFFVISCDNNIPEQNNNEIKTVMVIFFNESSYDVRVHRDSIYGPVIAEVPRSEREKRVQVRINDNEDDGYGTVFSVVYILYPINDDFSEIFISSYDPDVQFPYILKEGEPILISIPQPQNLICKTAFIRIINIHNLPVSFAYAGNRIPQAGNNNMTIASGMSGLYKFSFIPDEGEIFHNYRLVSNFGEVNIPPFKVMNGFTYNFIYNGSSVVKNCSSAPSGCINNCTCEDCICLGYRQPIIF